MITPADRTGRGRAADGTVTYGGHPTWCRGGTADLGDGGWYRTDSGGAFVAGEPTGASAWYPVNEHPGRHGDVRGDRHRPASWQVISNGVRKTDGPARRRARARRPSAGSSASRSPAT